MAAAAIIARPANEMIQYDDETEMKSFYQKLDAELTQKYKLPMRVTIPGGLITIAQVGIVMTSDLYPQVVYVTNYSLTEKEKIKKEAEKINSTIDNYLPIISQSSDSIVYTAIPSVVNPNKAHLNITLYSGNGGI